MNSSLFKLFRTIDWKYSVREIALVVIGILLALAINNWNQERKQYNKETDVIRELRSSLETNLTTVQGYLAYQEKSYKSLQLLIDHLKAGKPYSDTLDTYFGRAIGANMVLVDKSVYETIKSKGREIISNDSIRSGIATLFEYDFVYLEKMGQIDIDHLLNNIHPYYRRHFRNFSTFETATPISYQNLLNDPEYLGLLEWMRLNREIEIPVYRRTQKKLEDLIDLTGKELDSRINGSL